MFTKKGQSALEFLTTYGWAFLVALIMIGALAYFGVLNPARYLPERCSFGSEVTCSDFIIDATADTVSLRLTNSMGETVRVRNVTISTGDGQVLPCNWSAMPVAPSDSDQTWKDGETLNFIMEDPAPSSTNNCELEEHGIITDTKSKIQVDIEYYGAKSSEEYMHQVLGEVYAQVR